MISTITFRAALLGSLWWTLTGGAMASWYVGVPAIVLATLASMVLSPAGSWSLSGIARFLPFFIFHSLRGGADVAWRACHPRLPIAPEIFDYSVGLPPGRPLVFLMIVINLLPGTLSVTVDANILRIHVLTGSQLIAAELKAVEKHVALIFGVSLRTPNGEEFDEKV